MEISGKVIKIMELQTGEGKNGVWKKQEYVIEIPGTFPKKVCFSLWGDKIAQNPVQMGQEITVSFDLESREYQNRWYTDVKAWKISGGKQGDSVAPPASDAGLPPEPPGGSFGSFSPEPGENDDLPF